MKSLAVILLVAMAGCARFQTVQTDISYDKPSPGTPSRTITTKASSYTFFASKSTLAKWKAQQTDKTQGAEVGGLAQSSDAITTNSVALAEAIASGIVQGTAKALKP